MTDLIVDGHEAGMLPSADPAGGSGPQGGPTPTPAPTEDRLVPFRPAILAVRWATAGVSLVLAAPDMADGDRVLVGWTAAVLGNAVLRTFRPLRDDGSIRAMVVLLVEIALHVMAVIATGYWASPLVLLVVNTIIVAGFARGFGFAIRVGAASTLAVSVPEIGQPGYGRDEVARSAQWSTLLLLGGIVAGYARRISGEASRRHSLVLSRVSHLADTNALLTKLHGMAQTLPASLDLTEVLDSTMARLRGLVAFDSAVLLTTEASELHYTVTRTHGIDLTGEMGVDALPRPARAAVEGNRLTAVANLAGIDRPVDPEARCGLYVPLVCRSRLIGLLVIERREDRPFSEPDTRLVQGFVEPVALSIDNARWFKRLRTIGADEERTRIARDLHDRIGQSLAHLGFEIDRMVKRHDDTDPVARDLQELRRSLRDVVVEVRDALSDLRNDVTDTRDLTTTVHDFAQRLAERSGLRIEIDSRTTDRLPLRQEREFWRIAQEALVNVERHAEATEVVLRWRSDRTMALLEIEDDGRGLPVASADGGFGRADSFGLVGMRERADAIGASLELTSNTGEGTKVRCFLAKR